MKRVIIFTLLSLLVFIVSVERILVVSDPIGALAAANNAETKQIIARMLTRQRHIVRLLAKQLD